MGTDQGLANKGITAWLITWEAQGSHVKLKKKIAAILPPDTDPLRVLELVELLYVNSEYSPSERIGYADHKEFNPYPAEFHVMSGVQWRGQITCGHNPFLRARKVDNLYAPVDSLDEKKTTWVDHPRPDVEKIRDAMDE